MSALDLWLYPLALLGLAISAYVWYGQRSGKPIACWTRDCNRVIQISDGIRNADPGYFKQRVANDARVAKCADPRYRQQQKAMPLPAAEQPSSATPAQK